MDQEKVTEGFCAISEAVSELSNKYKEIGYAGLTTVVGGVILLATIAAAFYTNPSKTNANLYNIDSTELLIFAVLGVVLIIAGGVTYSLRIVLDNRIECLEQQVELNKLMAISSTGKEAKKAPIG